MEALYSELETDLQNLSALIESGLSEDQAVTQLESIRTSRNWSLDALRFL